MRKVEKLFNLASGKRREVHNRIQFIDEAKNMSSTQFLNKIGHMPFPERYKKNEMYIKLLNTIKGIGQGPAIEI
jgi:hypothetical protein